MPQLSDVSQSIKTELAALREELSERHRRGEDTFSALAAHSDGVDALLERVFREAGLLDEEFALIAVGGYGRRELCPHSDVDLLFLRQSPTLDERVRSIVRTLWDGGVDLGHSVRTVADCYRFMSDDLVTASALLENRFLFGDRRLYERFLRQAIEKYRARRGESFARAKLELLRESTEGPGRTIYVLEPHLKDGKCGLRDLQRILWVERIRRRRLSFEDFALSDRFESERIYELRGAYEFLLRVRSENHKVNGVKQDVLDADSILENARRLGYEGDAREAVEGLLADYYRHAGRVARFVRLYLETETEGRRFLGRLAFRILAKPVGANFLLYRGRLFLSPRITGRQFTPTEMVEEIASIFREAYDRNAKVSEQLREWIRSRVIDPELEFTGSSVARHAFLHVLRGETPDGERGRVGRLVKSMHETGFLGRIFPEFAVLEGLVNLDGHHQFTVDEHILRTLEVLDSLEGAPEDDDARGFGELYERLGDRLPLRLALLLHDIGKALPGDHSVSGRAAARLICERLGVPEEVSEMVAFLVYHHLGLFEVSQRRDDTDEAVIEAFARLVGSVRRLEMLYLLTYVDIRAVGPGTWTAWKGAQLADVYEKTRRILEGRSGESQAFEEVLQNAQLTEEERARVLEHCQKIGTTSYTKAVAPELMREHERASSVVVETGEAQVLCQALVGYCDVTIVCKDRPHLFGDLTGVLYSEGLNVLSASIFSRTDGVAIDVFFVEITDGVRVPIEERARRVAKKLRDIEGRRATISDMIHTWNRAHRFRPRRVMRFPKSLFGPAVKFVDARSASLSAIDISAGDRPGLLFALASALGRLNLDIRGAKVSTVSSRARDVFFVLEADGSKVTNPARIGMIRQALLDCIGDTSSGFTV